MLQGMPNAPLAYSQTRVLGGEHAETFCFLRIAKGDSLVDNVLLDIEGTMTIRRKATAAPPIPTAAVHTLLKAAAPPPLPAPPERLVPAAAVNILLSPQAAEEIRQSTRIAGSQPRKPDVMAFDSPADIQWQHYIARHADYQRIVGSRSAASCILAMRKQRDNILLQIVPDATVGRRSVCQPSMSICEQSSPV